MHKLPSPLILKTSSKQKQVEFARFGLNLTVQPGEDLAEVEGTPEEVIIYKSLAAGEGVLVEDTSMDVQGFDVGVNVRWALEKLKQDLLGVDVQYYPRATWRVMLAVHHEGVMHVAGHELHGHLIPEPRGGGFSFDPYFIPDGYTQTFGEMEDMGTKDLISARKEAASQLLRGECKFLMVQDIAPWQGQYQTGDAPGA